MVLKYEILEHTADLKIRVFGKTKEELFKNALLAMAEELKPEIDFSMPTQKETIKIKSPDLGALLVDFLSEVLYLSQTKKEIYNDVKFSRFSDTELVGELRGAVAVSFGEDIKAVTYHNLEVKEVEKGKWEAVVLFDI